MSPSARGPSAGIIATGERSVGEAPITCSACHTLVRFDTEHISGRLMAECRCGRNPVERVHALPHSRAKDRLSAKKVDAVCQACGATFQTLARKPGTGCSVKCRHMLRRGISPEAP